MVGREPFSTPKGEETEDREGCRAAVPASLGCTFTFVGFKRKEKKNWTNAHMNGGVGLGKDTTTRGTGRGGNSNNGTLQEITVLSYWGVVPSVHARRGRLQEEGEKKHQSQPSKRAQCPHNCGR